MARVTVWPGVLQVLPWGLQAPMVIVPPVPENGRYGSVLAGTVNVFATLAAVQAMDWLGRRTLLLLSSSLMALSSIGLTVALYVIEQQSADASADIGAESTVVGHLAVVFVLLFVIFFELGLGPIPWLIVAEMFPAHARGSGMTLCSSLNWTCNFIVGVSFPILNRVLTKWCFLPFTVCLLFTFSFVYEFAIETKGKTLEEIQDEIVVKSQPGVQSIVGGHSTDSVFVEEEDDS